MSVVDCVGRVRAWPALWIACTIWDGLFRRRAAGLDGVRSRLLAVAGTVAVRCGSATVDTVPPLEDDCSAGGAAESLDTTRRDLAAAGAVGGRAASTARSRDCVAWERPAVVLGAGAALLVTGARPECVDVSAGCSGRLGLALGVGDTHCCGGDGDVVKSTTDGFAATAGVACIRPVLWPGSLLPCGPCAGATGCGGDADGSLTVTVSAAELVVGRRELRAAVLGAESARCVLRCGVRALHDSDCAADLDLADVG